MDDQNDLNRKLVNLKSEREEEMLARFDACAQQLSTIAVPTCRTIVAALIKGPASVTEIAERTGCVMTAVSHHLGVLKMAGVVVAKRDGKQIIHSLAEGVAIHPPASPQTR